jgi:hypothetical protein
MAPRKAADGDPAVVLLEKLLVIQLYSMGATQDKIARTVGRQKLWVNAMLKGIPRMGDVNAKAKVTAIR